MSLLLDILKKFTHGNINTLGEFLFSIFILFQITNVFFPLNQYHVKLITEIKRYYTETVLNELIQCIYHMLITFLLLMFIIHLLYILLYFCKLTNESEHLSKKSKCEFLLMVYSYFVQNQQFPVIIWILDISFFLYFADLNFLKNTVNNFKEMLFPFTVFTIPFIISSIITIICCVFTVLEKFFAFSESIHKIDQL